MTADVDRTEDMVGKILEASRFDQRRIHLHPERLTLLPILDHVLNELESQRLRSSVEVQVEVESELEVWADSSGVHSVLRNLIDNAIRSVGAKGTGRILISAKVDGELVHLSVEDDGIGFQPDESKLLFEKFYRPGDELRRLGGGQGLGLYIVRRYLELGRGRFNASSDGPGAGATFEVWWPTAGQETAS